MTEAPRVKGISLRNAADSLIALEGRHALESAFERAPKALVKLFREGRVLASTWYPLTFHADLLSAIHDTTPGGRELMRKLGRHSMKNDMSGVYRAFAKLLGPDRSLQVSTRLFNHYYDTGRADIIDSHAGFALVRWTGCTGFDPRLFQVMMGSCESLMECVGGRHVRTRLRAGAQNGDDFCEMAAFWE